MGPAGQLTAKPDIDLWFEPTYENDFRLLKALEAMGFDVSEFRDESRPEPGRSFFKLDLGEFTLDVLPRIRADIPFDAAHGRKEEVELEGIPIHYIGFDDLLEDKKCMARKKDMEDIARLKREHGEG